MPNRKLVYHIATSLDGFIADERDGVDSFPMQGEHVTEYLASLRDYGATIMGRRTYEMGLKWNVTDPYPFLDTYVLSKSLTKSPHPRVQLVSGDVPAFVAQLKQQPGRDIYLCGGGELAGSLFEAGLVDEVLIKLNPLLLGRGRLLTTFSAPLTLRLLSTKAYDSGVVLLRYAVGDLVGAPAAT
jgi:dihydrofolate reductase